VCPSRGALPGFIYAIRLGFTNILVKYKVFVLYSKSILRAGQLIESLYRSTSIMGQTRYTNPWLPEGHAHISHVSIEIVISMTTWYKEYHIIDLY
jgi:hypothetical protein